MYYKMELNSVVQFIVKTQSGRGYSGMAAGSGWFYQGAETQNKLVIMTNAHVVNNTKAVFIRLPADHNTDIRVFPVGISTDLDLAVCKLDDSGEKMVRDILLQKYDSEDVPTLQMGDSDKVHPSSFEKLGAPRVIARGYPRGTEYQMFTDGRVSGIKHAMEQEYIVTTATIEPGNSGGPCVTETGEVIGINSMKMTNATETNIIIPSNRIKKFLTKLSDNEDNMKEVQHFIDEQKSRQQTMRRFVIAHLTKLKEDGIQLDEVKMNNAWEQHNLGGFKKTDGRITRVSISDWYQKHVLHKDGSYALFKKVMEHIHNDTPEEVVKMRKEGFPQFLSCEEGVKNPMLLPNTPARRLHMPRLGFRFNNANPAALTHYNSESGIIIRDVVEKSAFSKMELRRFDFLTHMLVDEKRMAIDNYGEVWYKPLNVSLPIRDIIHRQPFGTKIKFAYVRDGAKGESNAYEYDILAEDDKPAVRLLETINDSKHVKEVMQLSNGLVIKSLRLDDAMSMGLREYMQEHKQNDYRVVVCEILPGSDAFHTRNFRVGTVLAKINGEKTGNTWVDVCQQMEAAFENGPFAIESSKGRIMFASK
tara:strand:- start:12713 stop:14476 length:1764 start_codon:yes stop_codon:yes gene_type:complete